jgi:hypothetical protein
VRSHDAGSTGKTLAGCRYQAYGSRPATSPFLLRNSKVPAGGSSIARMDLKLVPELDEETGSTK